MTAERTHRDPLDCWVEAAEKLGYDLTLQPGETLGWKSVRPDMTTHQDYRWPFPGGTAIATAPTQHDNPCPQRPGDGLCIAKTCAGAGSGGIRLGSVLLVGWSGLLAESDDKLRVTSARVLALIDATRANLWYANLWGADLRGANLRGADLRGADLGYADLGYADANEYTVWPDGFDHAAAGVVTR